MVVSQNRGDPQYRPQNAITLIFGTPKMVPVILGNPHILTVELSYIQRSGNENSLVPQESHSSLSSKQPLACESSGGSLPQKLLQCNPALAISNERLVQCSKES